MSQKATLAQRLQQPQPLLAPGVYDALTALVAHRQVLRRCICRAHRSLTPAWAARTLA